MPDTVLPDRTAAASPDPQARIRTGVGAATPHDSARRHVTGEAVYTDDIREPAGTLHAAVCLSERAHARLLGVGTAACREAPGVLAVITATDIPGPNDCGPVVADDPILAEGEVQYCGQPILAVAAETLASAREACRLADIAYEDLPAILSIDQALRQGAAIAPTYTMTRGDCDAALGAAPHRVDSAINIGGQDHFYLEGHVALAVPGEAGEMLIYSSTQAPSEVQHMVARALGRPDCALTVEVRRLGGGFGGKETQPAQVACIAALLADRTGRPVKLRLDRDTDMVMTGKRHPVQARVRLGADRDGWLTAAEVDLAADCGFSSDLSNAVVDRAMFHADNAYYLPAATVRGHRCRTNSVSHTAFRGFGGPQGMLVIENAMDDLARSLGQDPVDVRMRNLYGAEDRNETHYGQRVEDNVLAPIMEQLATSSAYRRRRAEIAKWNQEQPVVRRGIALTPVKFGISFTATHLNQAGALVHVYADGSVHLNHGGTEMGQGLYVKVAQIVAEEFQIELDRIRISATSTDKVPNTSPTAASSGSDLNGMAAQAAARTIKQRLIAFAAGHFSVPAETVVFEAGHVRVGERVLTFGELAKLAHFHRISLSSTGFYRTPKISWDRATGTGRPFYYFVYGAAVSEAAVDTLTGETRVLRADLLQDIGRSLNPAVDLGQIEGGFCQGLGWLTCEELWWDPDGRLRTHAPSTYKIPTGRDMPPDLRVNIFENANREATIYRSKGVGEPPLMLAISAFLAIKDAVASTASAGTPVRLDAPATPERVLMAIETLGRRTSGSFNDLCA